MASNHLKLRECPMLLSGERWSCCFGPSVVFFLFLSTFENGISFFFFFVAVCFVVAFVFVLFVFVLL